MEKETIKVANKEFINVVHRTFKDTDDLFSWNEALEDHILCVYTPIDKKVYYRPSFDVKWTIVSASKLKIKVPKCEQMNLTEFLNVRKSLGV